MTDKQDFWTYFNVADELDGGMWIRDLDKHSIQGAKRASDALGLPWTPNLAAAEEYLNDHRDALSSERKCELCGDDFFPASKGDGEAEMAHEDDEYEMHPSIICHYACGREKGMIIA